MSTLLLAVVLAAPCTFLAGRLSARLAGPVLAIAAAAILVALPGAAGERLVVPWIPAWGVSITVAVDGLALLYGGLSALIALAVGVYGPAYVRHRPSERGPGQEPRFFGLLAAFLASMIGLVVARDLLLLLICFDLTAVVSYLLIGFERKRPEARASARSALLVTGVPSIGFLGAVAWLHAVHGTTDLDALLAVEPHPLPVLLVAAAALAKSAQFPLHGWLPRAMIAPTPVSAYLHSAAMVAAGVFLLTRLHPLLATVGFLPGLLTALGLVSILGGGVLALTRQGLKEILAWSTVAHYGHVLLLLGLGGDEAVAAACFYVIAHGLAKGGLFLVTGVVAVSTGRHALGEVGGLGRALPGVAAAAALLAAALAGLPLTLGFAKDEHLLAALLHRGPALAVAGVAAAALTLAYTWRWWSGIFLGPPRGEVRRVPTAMAGVVTALALAVTGLSTPLATALAEGAASDALGRPVAFHDPGPLLERPATGLAVGAWVLGAALARLARRRPLAVPARLPIAWFAGGLDRTLDRTSDVLHRLEIQHLRGRVWPLLLPAVPVLAAAFAVAGEAVPTRLTPPEVRDLPVALAFVLLIFVGVATAWQRSHIGLVLGTTALSAGLTATFALVGAPDVALVVAALGSLTTLLLFGGLALLPSEALRREAERQHARPRWREALVGIVAGLGALLFVRSALSRPLGAPVGDRYLVLSPEGAHSANVVSGLLVDFRGFDTVGESTALLIALLGTFQLLRSSRRIRT